MTTTYAPDTQRDLVLERVIDVPRDVVWRAWTQPEHIVKWFTPAPWQTVSATVDLRPGGVFKTVMRSPEGEEFPTQGCYLEVVENEKLVWTSALGPGYRPEPAPEHGPVFTAILTFEEAGPGRTRYRAIAVHSDAAGAASHAQMGFQEGWGAALDQLVANAGTI